MSERWRKRLLRCFALVVGLAAFLRLPLHETPERHRWWPPQFPEVRMPEARAATPYADEAVTETTQQRAPQPVPMTGPFVYRAPAGAHVQPLVGSSWQVSDFLTTRLQEMDELGDMGARADALYLLGIERQRSLNFGAAADYFEAFSLAPDGVVGLDEGAASLETAMAYRRALGQTERAIEDAARFIEIYGASHSRAATRVAFEASAMGDASALQWLRMRRLPPAERIQSEVRHGLQVRSVNPAEANRAFRRAERVWRREGGALMATSPGLAPTEWIEELSRTREALAEARFVRANARYRAVRGQHAPAFRGEPTAERVRRWVDRRLRPWLTRRLQRVAAVEAQLAHVNDFGLSTFSVAAAARQGQLYADVHAELRAALPKTITVDEGRLVMPQESITTDPVVQARITRPAIDHFESCMQLASHTRAYGEWSERCADGLARWVDRYRQREWVPARPWVAGGPISEAETTTD